MTKEFLTAAHAPGLEPLVDESSLTFEGGGETIWGRLVRPTEAPRAAVLLVHGWTSSAERNDLHWARSLARSGLTALAIDLPAHGRSTGTFEDLPRQAFVDAVVAGYDMLKAAAGDVPVLAVGTSMGGYLIARLPASRDLRAVALVVPGNYPDADEQSFSSFVGADAWTWRSQELPSRSTAAMRSLADFGGNLLVVQAANDDLVPATSVDNLVRDVPAARLKRVLVADAPHIVYTDRRAAEMIDHTLLAWLHEQTGQVRPL